MSFLSELPEEEYKRDAFDAFEPNHEFSLGTAKAMAWMAQIAYETDQEKIDRILATWGLRRHANLEAHVWGLFSTKTPFGLIASHPDAMIIAFTGTDPLSLGHWLTDFGLKLTEDDTHTGFTKVVDALWGDLSREIKNSQTARRMLFIAGHSLGAALGVLTAERAGRELAANIGGLYLIGAARSGGTKFADNFLFSQVTYRLVYGDDAISAWPTRRMGYCHVGRMLYCRRGETFDYAHIGPAGEDARDFLPICWQGLKDWVGSGFIIPPQFSVRRDIIGRLFRLLPPPVGDHIPDRYLAALDHTTARVMPTQSV